MRLITASFGNEMIYLDHNATAPVLPEVFEAMKPFFTVEWGNPSSAYRFGARLRSTLQTAREQVADLIGAVPDEIIFTSGATESNNAALHAALQANPGRRHIVTSTVEHSSVLARCEALERSGIRVTRLPVDRTGLLSLADLENAITSDTALVSLMWANNETGVLFQVPEIAAFCQARGVLFHCDAVQAAGKVHVNLADVPVDYLSLSGHKLGAPKGIGALYVRKNSPFTPLLYGGNQENGLRGGTEAVPLILGFAKAAELTQQRRPEYVARVQPLRDELEQGILSNVPNTELNGHPSQRIPNTTNIAFHGVESEALLVLLDQAGICVSAGSACLGNSDGPSHVIKAIKPDGLASRQSLRFSLGLDTTPDEIRTCIDVVSRSVAVMRQ